MIRSKSWLTVLVALLFLSFTVTPALAGTIPPGNLPPPSDFEPVDPAEFTPLAADYVPTAEVGVDAAIPAPVAPRYNNVYTKTPKFYFTPMVGASQYHIVVTDVIASPDVIVLNFYGTGSCTKFVCYLQSSTALKTFRYEAATGGQYVWAVEAMVGGSWKGLSSSVSFAVLSSGFTSTFDVDSKLWSPLSGTWERTTKGFYKGIGPAYDVISAMHKEFFLNDYVYEVTMKRKVEAGSLNRIIFMGTPNPLAVDEGWDKGFYFGYDNLGRYSLWRRDGGAVTTYLYNAVPTTFVEPYGWNTLTVWTDYPYIHLWINGAYLGYLMDDTYIYGYVGVAMFEGNVDESPLLVNSAKLYYSAVAPYAITDAALGEPLNLQVEGVGE